MAEHDPVTGLHDLADFAAQQADPLPADQVRRRGTQRRHRRHALTAAVAAVVVALGGGLAFGQLGADTGREPDPVAPPTVLATPSPTRTVTAANLLTTDDVPLRDRAARVVVADPGAGRPEAATSVCVPDRIDELGPTAVLTRGLRVEVTDPSFTPDPTDPLSGQPTIYSQALQFADAEQAERARRTYQGWVADCLDRLDASPDHELFGSDWKPDWRPVRDGGRTVGSFTELPTYRDRSDTSGSGYFESVGLTRVDDRLMITVDLIYGNEKHYSLDQEGDPGTGLPADPHFALVEAAAQRLQG